jgi:ketosteroid isomerase-like protein
VSLTTEVEASNREFCDALEARDFDRVAACFTADAVMLVHGVPPVSGPAEARAYFELAPAVRGAAMRPAKVEAAGDAIAEAGTYSMTVEMEDGPLEDAGKYMAVHRRGEDGRLRLWFDTYQSDAAAATVAEEG